MRSQRVVCLVLMSLFLVSAVAAAQGVATGAIGGLVRDTSGAVLPGVTVEAASPALIERVRTVVTDGQGLYRIVDLRPGLYSVTFTLSGFSQLKREGIELTTAFTATVNAELRVGTIEEAVTVSGAAPVVDTQNILQKQTLPSSTLNALPSGKTLSQYAALIPAAVTSASRQDVGGNVKELGGTFQTHGGRGADMMVYDAGMLVTNFGGTGVQAGGNSTSSFNRAAAQETIVQTGGNSAESLTGGVQVNIVPREGGNSLSGSFNAEGTSRSLVSDNLTEGLQARGLTIPSPLRKVYDVNGGFGGPLKRDKVWFFESHRAWYTSQYAAGNYFNANPNSLFYTRDLSRLAYDENWYRSHSFNLTWQAAAQHKLNVSLIVQDVCSCFNGALGGTAAPEATGNHHYMPNYSPKMSWSFPATNRLLLQAGASAQRLGNNLNRIEGVTEDAISITELSTNYQYRARAGKPLGGGTSDYGSRQYLMVNEQVSASYVTGSHAFKTGVFMQQASKDTTGCCAINGGIAYSFRNRAPASVTVYALPYGGEKDSFRLYAFFAQDQWTIRKMTLNLGLRFESFEGQYPDQHLPAGPLVPERNFAGRHGIPSLKDVSPRLGAAYDLFGNGKTALKVSLGRYNGNPNSAFTLTDRANPVNSMVTNVDRTWDDTNGNYAPDCDFRIAVADGECGPVSDAAFGQVKVTTHYTDDVVRGFGKREYSWQGSATVQHELRSGIALNVGYFRTWYGNFQATDNLTVGPADFDQFCIAAPTDARLPGSISGSQICGLYDVNPARFGQVDNLVTFAKNFGKQKEVFNGVDITLSARFGRGGQVSGGLSTGRTITDNCFVVDSPQQARSGFCHVSPPWSAGTQIKFLAVYPLPWDFQSSAIYQNRAGVPIAASYVVPNAQITPSLHRNLGSCLGLATCNGTATIDLIPPGSLYESRIQQFDLRFTRIFRLQKVRVEGDFDIYNAFNAAPILSLNSRYGSQWLNATSVLSGRVFKFGFQFSF